MQVGTREVFLLGQMIIKMLGIGDGGSSKAFWLPLEEIKALGTGRGVVIGSFGLPGGYRPQNQVPRSG